MKTQWLSGCGVLMVVFLSACQPKPATQSQEANDLSGHAEPILVAASCAKLMSTLESCPAQHFQNNARTHMMAVLKEQTAALPEHQQGARCQELLNFWQPACGVTPKP